MMGTGMGKIWYQRKYRYRYQKKVGTKKVPVSVSKKFGTGKSIGIGIVYHFGYRHTLNWMLSLYNTLITMSLVMMMMMLGVMRSVMMTGDIAGRYIGKLAGYHPLTHDLLFPLLLCHRLQ